MNYARLNFLQLDHLGHTRSSWGAFCYEIARDGGASMQFEHDGHRYLAEVLRQPAATKGLEDVAVEVLRGLEAKEDAESLAVGLESMAGAARVLSPVAVRSISTALSGFDEQRLQALLDRASAPAASTGQDRPALASREKEGLSETVRDLIDFYRRAAARGQYVLLADLPH